MQVNSLGLTEEQPENNVQRIVLEMLGVTLSKGARARAVQLPCWNEALGLPTPWDQQWSLRIQQVLAYESDLLEYDDLFDGSKVVEAKVAELCEAAETELQRVLDGGGSFAMIDDMKGRLVQSHAERVRRIESGELQVVGVNSFTETEPSPLAAIAQRGGIVTIDPEVEREQRRADRGVARRPRRRRGRRRARAPAGGRGDHREPRARHDRARPGGRHRRRVGRRAPRRVRRVPRPHRRRRGRGAGRRRDRGGPRRRSREIAAGVRRRPIRLLVGKPGLDGHSNGAEQIAVAARDAGMEVVYQGIRLSPAEIAAAARDEDVDVVGLSILSGSHLALVPETLARAAGGRGRRAGRGRWHHPRRATVRSWRPWAWRGCTHRRTSGWPDHGRHRRAGPGSPRDEPSGQGDSRPMRMPMEDPRLVVGRLRRVGRARRRRGRGRDERCPCSPSWPAPPA